MSLTDKTITEAAENVRTILSHVSVTDSERTFVDDAARKVAQTVWDLLMAVPDEDRASMRGIIMTVAIAMNIGPWQVWDEGSGYYVDPARPPRAE